MTTSAKAKDTGHFVVNKGDHRCTPVCVEPGFFVFYAILFLGMTRRSSIFDEGIVLTAAMRVERQIPHRDFYALYGPAQFYLLCWLFKLFGRSIFVERLFDFLSKALVITAVYAITSAYCRKSVAVYTSAIALLWLFALNQWSGSPMILVSLLNIIGSALIVPVFAGKISVGRMFVAGTVAGRPRYFDMTRV